MLLDDRDERPGIKFKDADLIGTPFRATVGKSFTNDGVIELRDRRSGKTENLPLSEVVSYLLGKISEELEELKR